MGLHLSLRTSGNSALAEPSMQKRRGPMQHAEQTDPHHSHRMPILHWMPIGTYGRLSRARHWLTDGNSHTGEAARCSSCVCAKRPGLLLVSSMIVLLAQRVPDTHPGLHPSINF